MRISRTRGLEDKEEVSRPSNPPLNNELPSNEVENEAILPSTITDEMSIAIQMQLWADATKERRMLNLTQDNTSAEKGATSPVESLTTEPASVNLSTAAPNATVPFAPLKHSRSMSNARAAPHSNESSQISIYY